MDILKNKYFLYATEFFSGMSVMAIELGASRLLAPYFSSSQIIWTVIIGAIMIAMSLGNIWGGRSVDKNPDPNVLYKRLMIAAVWTAAIPIVGKYVIGIASGIIALIVTKNFLVWASLLSCALLFVFPLMILGTVTPSLVKFATTDLKSNGKVVGKLGALNTIGSIVGTFIPTFVTIPAVGTAATFIIFASILLLLSLIYFITSKKRIYRSAISISLIIVFSILSVNQSFAISQKDIVHEDESIYNYLQVRDNKRSTILSTNVLFGVQSIKMKNDTLTGMYYDYALAAPIMAGVENIENPKLLILGLGTGTYAELCKTYFDFNTIDGVEIDKKIIDISKNYFDLSKDINAIEGDGRIFLESSGKYDVILIDAYQDITIPFQMSSVEFFNEVKEHLTDNGVMIVNMNMHSEGEDSINEYLSSTIAHVFSNVYTINASNVTNRVLFASSNSEMINDLSKNLDEVVITDSDDEKRFKDLMIKISENCQKVSPSDLILTDDCAPVELLGMHALDGIIENELNYYKALIKKDGIGALLEE